MNLEILLGDHDDWTSEVARAPDMLQYCVEEEVDGSVEWCEEASALLARFEACFPWGFPPGEQERQANEAIAGMDAAQRRLTRKLTKALSERDALVNELQAAADEQAALTQTQQDLDEELNGHRDPLDIGQLHSTAMLLLHSMGQSQTADMLNVVLTNLTSRA